MLPPGRAWLAIVPSGASPRVITMGMVWVARCAAWMAGVVAATMTATSICASSAAKRGSRSYLPSAKRYSMAMFLPST